MAKIGVYSRNEFILGTARLDVCSENYTITATGRKGEVVTLEQFHRHESPIVDGKRKVKAEALFALMSEGQRKAA